MEIFVFIAMGGAVGFLVARILCALLTSKGFFKKIAQEGELFDLQGEISPYLQEEIEELAGRIKVRHPMISFFLTADMESSFKQTAREELLLRVPRLKKTLLERMQETRLQEKIKSFLAPYFWKVSFLGLFVGCAFGLLTWCLTKVI